MTYCFPESYSMLNSWDFFFLFSPVVKLIEETLNINKSQISSSVKQSLLAERRGHQSAGEQPWPVICNQLLSTSPAHISAGHTSGGQDLVKSAPAPSQALTVPEVTSQIQRQPCRSGARPKLRCWKRDNQKSCSPPPEYKSQSWIQGPPAIKLYARTALKKAVCLPDPSSCFCYKRILQTNNISLGINKSFLILIRILFFTNKFYE